ncbi:GCNT1-like protein [Mya arenaria]|uniref:GCNT1-like protein n=1 Tax=Mya arenaria TaxID=6604 RepID=A0ABY7FLD4_MYAAR|nr:GCNT1-like protein [Mya arenaria]
MSWLIYRSFRSNFRGLLLLIICGITFCLLNYNRYLPCATSSAFDQEGTSNVTGMLSLFPTVRPLTFQRDKAYFVKDRKVKQVNCAAIFDGDENETALEERLASEDKRYFLQPIDYINMTSNCSKFILERGYVIDSLDENEFPIAFSILMYTAIEQAERLLRAIYRPQNVYCFHIDSKSGIDLYHAMSRIAECFDNVHVLEKRVDVQWGHMSVLEPEILCMKYVWNRSAKWKYFINLTGMEFPLKTNYELVRILHAYNGSNDIEGTIKRLVIKLLVLKLMFIGFAFRAIPDRWANAGPPPKDIALTKGGVQIISSRGFVDFALHDPRAAELLNWTRKTMHPDETFFTTLNHNPILGVPGSYRGIPETDEVVKPFLARYINWSWDTLECHGKYLHSVCIHSARDLPPMKDSKKLFVNKFHQEFHPLAYDCLEELLFNRTRDRHLGLSSFNSTFYSNLDFVKNRVEP